MCHNELGPHNTVFAGDVPIAFIDWDDAAPGTRLFDHANAIWSFADFGDEGGSVVSLARRIRLMCEACGWDDAGTIVEEIKADPCCALANHEHAGRRKPAEIFREMVQWMDTHAKDLESP